MTKRSQLKIRMTPEVQIQVLKSFENVTKTIVEAGVKLGDRIVQASVGSPYASWATITLLSAMGTRARLWSPYTSDLVTGAGLTLLGAATVEEAIPLLGGLTGTEKMIDNKWDKSKVISPWAIEIHDSNGSAVDDLLIKLGDKT